MVLRAAGTNCDRETAHSLASAGFDAQRVHIFSLTDDPGRLEDVQFLVVPGGFSYGDDVASGKILANQLRHRLAGPLNDFVQAGKLVLGICNGFQVLIKSGLLPSGRIEPAEGVGDVTITWNDNGQFEDRWVHLRSTADSCVFLERDELIALPIAHGEGKFVPADDGVLAKLRTNGQLALRYVDSAGHPGPFPINPNGSVDDVAGLCDPTGRVLGLMPHPERFTDATQHPNWTRHQGDLPDGMKLFQRARAFFE
jgi:phosphoribosylformylglycinamidine synthase